MSTLRYDIIHIGTPERNPFWGEKTPQRTAVATCTLITDGGVRILVDPGLPGEALTLALHQRTGLRTDQIGIVFLTSRRPDHVRGLLAFPTATHYMHQPEIEAWRADPNTPAEFREKLRPAPEQLTERVHIFPTPGPTAGHCSLLLKGLTATIMVAGDVVQTRDHFESTRVWDGVTDIAAAKESLRELIELADVVIPGHDNVFPARGLGWF